MHERTIGNVVQWACAWEVLARKAGNVCPGREYPDLAVNDFLASAAAVAPILDRAPTCPIGVTIRDAIVLARQVTATNTNLGIVLLLAPLASVPLDEPLRPALNQRLHSLTIDDSRNVFEAVRLAAPAGLGRVQNQDVASAPTLPLREVMSLARHHDRIADQYASDFQLVLDLAVPELVRQIQAHGNVERGIVELQLWLLAQYPDSHIGRKRGAGEANEVRDAARTILSLGGLDSPAGRRAFLDMDAWMRADNHARNPGTTADLSAACLFVALRNQDINPGLPFIWQTHPFDE